MPGIMDGAEKNVNVSTRGKYQSEPESFAEFKESPSLFNAQQYFSRTKVPMEYHKFYVRPDIEFRNLCVFLNNNMNEDLIFK